MSTPIRAQYLRVKERFPVALLPFRLGDCYELYDHDATITTRELGLSLATREFVRGEHTADWMPRAVRWRNSPVNRPRTLLIKHAAAQ